LSARVEDDRVYFSNVQNQTERQAVRAKLKPTSRFLGRGLRLLGRGSKRFGKAAGRTTFRAARRGFESGTRKATGLSPSELQELGRLRRLARARGFTKDDAYLLEARRLKELEGRYLGQRRKGQAVQAGRFIYRAGKRLHEGPKRLRA